MSRAAPRVLTAHHGNASTRPGSHRAREHVPVPVPVDGGAVAPRAIGCRNACADFGQRVARGVGFPPLATGDACPPPGNA